MISILDLNPENYQRHHIHSQERDWAETNCYSDVWIEQLHALKLDPIAAMAFTLSADFEGDQWTFFKFQLNDLFDLYGIEVQELVVWRQLTDHIQEQVKLGRPVLVELDSIFLPDTAGTAYQSSHVKTTVSVNNIDMENQRLGYFHAQGYYHLEGDDFKGIFRLNDDNNSSAHLAPYVEIAKLDRMNSLSNEELTARSVETLKRQLALIPTDNPFIKFKARFEKDFPWLLEQSIDVFHEYAFVTFRQFGACFELAATYLKWLSENGETGLEDAAKNMKNISEITKVYQFQLARSVSRKKPLDFNVIEKLGDEWEQCMTTLRQKYQ